MPLRAPNTPHSLSVEPKVESYFREIGIGGYQDRKVFWRRLREKYGPIAEKVADAVSAREEGQDIDVYSLKNTTLALSIDVTSQYFSQLYEEYLSWMLRAGFPEPQSLLDVACDNGILTCFYATLYPEATVVGIDKSEQGIACAQQLARRLKLPNVRFEVHNLLSLGGDFPDQSFDLIVSTLVFQEVFGFPEDLPKCKGWSTEETTIGWEDSNSVKVVAGLARLLRHETGTLVSMERCPDAATVAWWIRLLNRAGLSMDTDRSHLLHFYNVDREHETLPILVATRCQCPPVNSIEDILVFRMYRDRDEEW